MPGVRDDQVSSDGFSGLIEENRTLREKNEELETLLNQDPYTGLPIRRLFDRHFDDVFLQAQESGTSLSVAMLRLDSSYAKIKNARDRSRVLLFKTILRIQSVIGETLFQSDRLDEFLIVLPSVSGISEVVAIGERILNVVQQPHEQPAEDISFGCYIGFSVYPANGSSREDLISNAEIALEEAERWRLGSILYTDQMGQRYRDRYEIDRRLSAAIDADFAEFEVYFQPFVDTEHRIRGAEALIRWRNATLGAVSPARFIPIAEETGLIRQIGQWVLFSACRQVAEWHNRGFDDLFVSVNLSPSQFKQHDLIDRVKGVLSAVKLDGRFLKLELTERTVMENPESAIRKMRELRDLGIRLSIDDFGTGYSSFSYLGKFPIDTLKIDKSFIDDVHTNLDNQEIVRAIISLARNIRIETLAEGVENRGQRDFLYAEGCRFIQGYFYSKPVDSESFERLISGGGFLPGADA
ncbi:MAG: GGDEF domain-containing protein [Spirochaetaceae bacterium]|nr:MAG: GGDEF domain-containing protein [Spirochaetaceae bacterium]